MPLMLGSAPSRTKTYTAGQIISPTDVTENEDNIFSYLQAGVDTLRNGSVTSAAIFDGTITSSDLGSGSITNATIAATAAIDFSKLATLTSGNILVGSAGGVATSVAMSGDITISNAGVTTIGADKVALTTDTTGNYAAGDAEAGNATGLACTNCVAGTEIALGSDAQGDVMYYDGTDWARLGAGTSGFFLKTQGAGANPTWAQAGGQWIYVETLTMSGTSVTSSALPTTSDVFALVFDQVVSGSSAVTMSMTFDNSTNYDYQDYAGTITTGAGSIILDASTSGNQVTSGVIVFNRVSDTNNDTTVQINLSNSAALATTDAVRARRNGSGTMTTVTLAHGGGGFSSGKVFLFRLSQQ